MSNERPNSSDHDPACSIFPGNTGWVASYPGEKRRCNCRPADDARAFEEVVIVIAGRTDERTHAYDRNPEGRTACGLYPDQIQSRRAWKIAPFTRCTLCEAATS